MTKTLSTILLLGIISATAFYSKDLWKNFLFPSDPCTETLTYSIGTFDERFGIREDTFIQTIQDAEKVWENARGTNLFGYSATGTIKINLLYDYRQEATVKLSGIGSAIDEGKQSYEQVKARYNTLTAKYERESAAYDREAALFDQDKAAYEKKVSYWNENGGAPKSEYEAMQKEGRALNARADALNRQAKELNSLTNDINGTGSVLNTLADELNVKVNKFNTIGASTGEEFSEGEYVYDSEGERINVYQFETTVQLRRLLEHELGHALGLGHVEDSEAIMYRLNSSENETLTPGDEAELEAACQAPPRFFDGLFH